jgi:ABC-type transport system substrate-binding protein
MYYKDQIGSGSNDQVLKDLITQAMQEMDDTKRTDLNRAVGARIVEQLSPDIILWTQGAVYAENKDVAGVAFYSDGRVSFQKILATAFRYLYEFRMKSKF